MDDFDDTTLAQAWHATLASHQEAHAAPQGRVAATSDASSPGSHRTARQAPALEPAVPDHGGTVWAAPPPGEWETVDPDDPEVYGGEYVDFNDGGFEIDADVFESQFYGATSGLDGGDDPDWNQAGLHHVHSVAAAGAAYDINPPATAANKVLPPEVAHALADPPPTDHIPDDDVANLALAWYYAGYYSGLQVGRGQAEAEAAGGGGGCGGSGGGSGGSETETVTALRLRLAHLQGLLEAETGRRIDAERRLFGEEAS